MAKRAERDRLRREIALRDSAIAEVEACINRLRQDGREHTLHEALGKLRRERNKLRTQLKALDFS